jgi:putative addiction module component (TIGR02574 family)
MLRNEWSHRTTFPSELQVQYMVPSQLPPEIRCLPIPVRVRLADQIWDSVVEDGASFELTGAQKAELDRRLAAQETTPNLESTWEEVKKRLLGE